MGKLLTCLVILSTLSGCSNKEFHLGWYDKCLPSVVVDNQKVYPSIKSEYLTCSEIPIPDNNITQQSQVASYLVNLTFSGKECKSNLNYVRMSLQKFSEDINTSK